MRLLSAAADFKRVKSDSLIEFCTKASLKDDPVLEELNGLLHGAVQKTFDSGEFDGSLNQTVVFHSVPNIAADRVILAGVGEKEKVNSDSYRQASGTLSKQPAVKNSATLAFFFGGSENKNTAQAVIEGLMLGRFEMKDYKTGDESKDDRLKAIHFYGRRKSQIAGFKEAMSRGLVISEGVNLARRLASFPGNFLTPVKFAAEAKSLAQKHRLKFSVLNEIKIKTEKMGALLAVAQGSIVPPRFVILEYGGAKAASKSVVLVGKGITFDSGGITLKPGKDMGEMKGDMQGGAIVLAALITLARLKTRLNIVGLIPLAENMPSSKALKPGDIIKSRKGKTIEIISTDAEGRLILADALDYADKFKPQAVVDVATLTGGALYVLGYAGAPIIGNNKELMDAIRDSSEATAERVWEMPIWDEHRELMKSSIADLKNSGGRPANTITAAAFLENFIGDWPWAHIDIASVDNEKTGRPYVPKGCSGVGLRLLVELLSNWKDI